MPRAADSSPHRRVTAVMPVREGRGYLERSLPALFAAGDGIVDQVIVVDDGSNDESAAFAREAGAAVLPSGGQGLGPACGRNVGVAHATGELVLFVDADVVIHPDAVALVVAAFRDPDTVAVFGSYDASPPHRSFASQYMNLRHHHVHQQPSDDAATFWSGLGAVRRDPFLAVGGFDSSAFPRPSVEDIDLGRRLRANGGRIRRIPAIQGTHLKRWSLAEVIRTDIMDRAVPWSQLMLRHPGAFDDLNVGRAERRKALLAAALVVALAAALLGWLPPWTPIPILLGAGLANRRLAAVFRRRNGVWFMVRGVLFHQLYYLYSAAVYACCAARHALRATGAEPAPSYEDPGANSPARPTATSTTPIQKSSTP